MFEKQITIQSEEGLHARPAGLFVKKASEFSCEIELKAKNGTANAKSIMSVMGLGLDKGAQVTLVANGVDASMAIDSLSQLLEA